MMLALSSVLWASAAMAQVGPRVQPQHVDAAPEVRVAGSVPVYLDLIDFVDGDARLLYQGLGATFNVNPVPGFAASGSFLGLVASYSNEPYAPPLWHGNLAVEFVMTRGRVRPGLFIAGTRLGSRTDPSSGLATHRVDGFLGPALLFGSSTGRVRGDLHLSVLQVGSHHRADGWDKPFSPLVEALFEDPENIGIFLVASLMTSEAGVDLSLAESGSDWLRVGFTGPAPTLGWQHRWERFDLTVRAATIIGVHALEVQVGWRRSLTLEPDSGP